MVNIKIEKVNEKAVIPFKSHDSDFCYDVVAVSAEQIAWNTWKYRLGFKYELDREEIISKLNLPKDANISIDFRPRSSIWQTGMVLSNAVGTLDELYRGEVCAIFYHVVTCMPRYQVGDKIGQIKLGITLPINFVEGTVSENTERGTNGFGSTGK